MRMDLGKSFIGLWTDPGAVHTGFVVVSVNLTTKTFKIEWMGEVNGLEESAILLDQAVSGFGVRLWVYEGFRLYADKASVKIHSELEEVQTIGAMRLAALRYRQSLHVQKQFAVNIKVPNLGDNTLRLRMKAPMQSMPSGHTRDAFRHFLYTWCYKFNMPYPIMEGLYGRHAPAPHFD
jgi:hypothetical protein